MLRSLLPLCLGLTLAVGTTPAFAQAFGIDKVPAPEKPLGPMPNKDLPIGGFVKAPAGSTRLVEKVFGDAVGYPLYVLDRECFGQCAVLFPPLTPAKDAKPSGDWQIRTRLENGALQWVYKGKPVYTFLQDKKDEHPMADNVIPGVALMRP